jgi:small subunit ribosomal protein S16
MLSFLHAASYLEHNQGFSERIPSVLMIRLARVGARKQPHYRVVVIEKDRARNGRSVEVVGTYNPRTNPASVDLKRERIDYWTSKGAQMSETVGKLVARYKAPEVAPAEATA